MMTVAMVQKKRDEKTSVIWVLIMVVLALVGGLLIKTAVLNQTRPVSGGGVAAQLPSGWLVQEGAGDLALLARNPQSPSTRYRVYQLPQSDDLALVANGRYTERARVEETFRVLDETPIIVDGQDGYKVSYAFVDLPATGLPTVVEGVDYYLPKAGALLVVTYEADQQDFDAGFEPFQAFRASVTVEAGK